jgi:hypothetical protein
MLIRNISGEIQSICITKIILCNITYNRIMCTYNADVWKMINYLVSLDQNETKVMRKGKDLFS